MSSSVLFPVKVLFLFVAIFAATLWLLDGAPVPLPAATVKPLQPDPTLPTFAESTAKALSQQTGRTVMADDVNARLIGILAETLISSSLDYKKRPCKKSTRKYVAGRIEHYFKMRRKHPHVTFEPRIVRDSHGGGPADERRIEDTLQDVFLEGLFVLDDFSSPTRKTLRDIVHPGSEAKQRYYWKCQA